MNKAIVGFLLGLTVAIPQANTGVLEDHGVRQCLIVTTDSWSSPKGTMSMFETDRNARWRRRARIPVVIGRAGLAWGRGLIHTSKLAGPVKKEGDDKAPAGIFRLTSVFGWEPKTKMPVVGLTPHIVCVDDSQSPYYNQILNELNLMPPDSLFHSETLAIVEQYRLGVFVEHNVPAKAGDGSCIFLHIWKNPGTATSGCTAMAEQNLIEIVRWLDPNKHPVLVQLPQPVYERLRHKWQLPKL